MSTGNVFYELLEHKERGKGGLKQENVLRGLLNVLSKEDRERIQSDEFAADCRNEFHKFDEDGSGQLDGQELCQATVASLSRSFAQRIGRGAKLRRLALAFDADGDGMINEQEFVTFVRFCVALEIRDYFEKPCVNRKAPGVWIWGSDLTDADGSQRGKLGAPRAQCRASGYVAEPVEPALPAEEAVQSVSAGSFHTLVLQEDGDVFSWGGNSRGELGLGEEGAGRLAYGRPQAIPMQVVISDVAAGDGFSVFLDLIGWVWTCGANDRGQLGLGDTADRNEPTRVEGMGEVTVDIAASSHVLAVGISGSCWAWGANDHGQLGVGELKGPAPDGGGQVRRTFERDPVKIASRAGGKKFERAGAGGRIGAKAGQECVAEPVFNEIIHVACGQSHSLATTTDGRLFVWGAAAFGQLGLGEKVVEDVLIPTLMGGEYGKDVYVSHIAAGAAHSACIGLLLDELNGCQGSYLHTFGRNDMCQCGAPTEEGMPVWLPRQIFAEQCPGEKVSVACGENFTTCVTNDHSVWFWGLAAHGVAGQDVDLEREMPPGVPPGVLPISKIETFIGERKIGAVTAGRSHVAAWCAPVPETLPPEQQAEKSKGKRKKGKKKKGK